jgi:hypothetical protein
MRYYLIEGSQTNQGAIREEYRRKWKSKVEKQIHQKAPAGSIGEMNALPSLFLSLPAEEP